MRYLLAGATVAVVLLALLAVSRPRGGVPNQGAAPASLATDVAARPTPIQPVIPSVMPTLERIRVPYTRLPSEAVSRLDAIQAGRAAAGRMGDEDAELIDALLTTLADAEWRAHAQHDMKDGPPDDALVWLVRLRGRFRPASAPGPEQMIYEDGWAFAVVNAKTGQTMGYGYNDNTTPIR
jgi:hypothetical protein